MFDPQDESMGEWGGGLFPANGPHPLEISGAEYKVSRKGTPMIEFAFTVVEEGPDDGKEIKYQYYTLTGGGAAKFRDLCLAVDPKMPAFDPTTQKVLNKLFVGRRFVGETLIKEEVYNGTARKKCQVASHRALSTAEGKAAKEHDGKVPF